VIPAVGVNCSVIPGVELTRWVGDGLLNGVGLSTIFVGASVGDGCHASTVGKTGSIAPSPRINPA
jgi:hypothetical protein